MPKIKNSHWEIFAKERRYLEWHSFLTFRFFEFWANSDKFYCSIHASLVTKSGILVHQLEYPKIKEFYFVCDVMAYRVISFWLISHFQLIYDQVFKPLILHAKPLRGKFNFLARVPTWLWNLNLVPKLEPKVETSYFAYVTSWMMHVRSFNAWIALFSMFHIQHAFSAFRDQALNQAHLTTWKKSPCWNFFVSHLLARDELHHMLSCDELREAALLVLAKKQDLPDALSVSDVTEPLGLNQIRDRRWYIQAACAKTGDGLYEGLDWFSDVLNKRKWVWGFNFVGFKYVFIRVCGDYVGLFVGMRKC